MFFYCSSRSISISIYLVFVFISLPSLHEFQLGLDYIFSEVEEFTGLFIALSLLKKNFSPKEVRRSSSMLEI